MGSMVFNVKPMVFPSREVGGEFVWEVFVAGPLTQLDAGAPYNGKVLGGGLRFDPEEEAEKIPVGFDSKKSLAVIDENWNMANRIWVEMVKLKPVVIQKASEEGARGEG
jgi:hypothetical protein